MQQQMRIYFVNNFLYNLARVLPHAVLSVILLSKNLSYAEISFIQSMYMLGALIFEFPSGILSDMFSEKRMYLLSLLLITIAYSMVLIYSDVIMLSLAWFIYGISNAAMTGTLDTFFIKELKKSNLNIKKFIADNNYSILLSGLIGGSLGAVIYNIFGINIYFISIGIFIMVFIFTLLGIKRNKTNEFKGQKVVHRLKDLMADFKSSLLDKNYLKLFLVVTLSSVILSVFFQFWQLLFLDKNIPSVTFALIYPAFQLGSIFSNYLFMQSNHKPTYNYFYIISFTVFFLSGIFVQDIKLVVVFFFIPYSEFITIKLLMN